MKYLSCKLDETVDTFPKRFRTLTYQALAVHPKREFKTAKKSVACMYFLIRIGKQRTTGMMLHYIHNETNNFGGETILSAISAANTIQYDDEKRCHFKFADHD